VTKFDQSPQSLELSEPMTIESRFPAEWEPQSGVILAWPHAGTDWAPRLAEVERAYVGLVSAVARFAPVLLCVADAALEERAAELLAGHVEPARLRFARLAYDDTWLRDSGPITLREGDGFRLLDFHFTAWGGKFEAALDDQLVAALEAQGAFGSAVRERVDFALEGGAIETDGDGTLLSTWRCLHERHPSIPRHEIERVLRDSLRQQRVLWLERGYLEGDDTDAHIDTLARFCSRTAIVYQGCQDRGDQHFGELQAMAAELAQLRTTVGQPYRLFELPWALPILDQGRRLAASYANFLIVDGAVLMPAYGDEADGPAARVLAEAFPDREIVPVDCRPLIWQNGSLHCLTMQLPQGVLA
jgi:agmatine/peptidylarginine deiminase